MKLEVGMYYRYKGIIGKYYKPDLGKPFFTNQHKYTYNEIANYGKFSHNIIDLIQSKDLIVDTKNNVYVVDRVEGNYVFTTSKNEYGLIITLVDYQIKSILTKEQFESMSYKVN